MRSPVHHVRLELALTFIWLVGLISQSPAQSFGHALPLGVAIATTADHQTAYLALEDKAHLQRWRYGEPGPSALSDLPWLTAEQRGQLIDMHLGVDDSQLVLVLRQPPRVVICNVKTGLGSSDSSREQSAAIEMRLPGEPAQLAVTVAQSGQAYACVTLTADHAVYIVPLAREPSSSTVQGQRVPLNFAPKCVAAVDHQRVVVADAFNDQLAVINLADRRVDSVHAIDGHHLAGLAVDQAGERLLVAHQRLSGHAHTSRDDIHWGLVMRNLVTSISLSELLEAEMQSLRGRTYRLGRTGNGASDPAGVAVLGGQLVIAISGRDDVALVNDPTQPPQFIKVGRVPTRLWRFGSDQVLCLNWLDGTVSQLSVADDRPRELARIGQTRQATSAEELGRQHFYSSALSHDSWMSCNSCHIDGHAADILADTLGDGRFGSPKRIPSLANVSRTGPWAWDGSQPTLLAQVEKTLSSTMHTPELEGVPNRSQLAQELTAYLQAATGQPSNERGPVQAGEPLSDSMHPEHQSEAQLREVAAGGELFKQRCATCHHPESSYTSPKMYDVELIDEHGQSHFNPPSLLGVRHRRALMHDGRFDSLETLLRSHPPASALNTTQIRDLRAFLFTL